MLEMIHCLFFLFVITFGSVFKFVSRKSICLQPRRCGEVISFGFVFFSDLFGSISGFFGFKSEHVVTLVSTVVDGKSQSASIFALTFQTSRCCFRRCLSLGLPLLRLTKELALPNF